jgi:processing peptidase subunit alpha
MTDKIDQVDPNAVRRVAMKLFGPESGNKPSVVCMGYDDVSSPTEVFRHYGLAA